MSKQEESDTLSELLSNIKRVEKSLEAAAEVDNAEVLRECADVLQRVREHYWPLYLRATTEMREVK